MDFIPGEVKTYTEDGVVWINKENQLNVQDVGILVVTNYRLFFGLSASSEPICNVPLNLISRIHKIGGASSKKQKHSYRLKIYLKDMRNIILALDPVKHSRRAIYDRLSTYSFPCNYKRQIFAYKNQEIFDSNSNGWKVFDPVTEYRRILDFNNNGNNWFISDINENYKLCDTYPSKIVILNEKLVSPAVVKSVAAFRSRNRLPVLTWMHRNGATLTRCSQPLSGVKNKRSSDDEFYLSMLIKTNSNQKSLVIMDARPRTNAIANRTRNGGYEKEDAYKSTIINFLNIHNIHVMRDSLSKLKEAILSNSSAQDFDKVTEGWLKHIRRILQGAYYIMENIEEGSPVLIHCSDGWDRTSQLTSTSMLLLDPYYRSLKGFQVLIEKEWLSFGHKFQSRIGHGDSNYNDSDRSPVFLQFLDCTAQLIFQFPTAFEFNEDFLITIADHLYSCRFGTFLCNSEKERMQQQIKEKTISLWSFINTHKDSYLNVHYSTGMGTLKPTIGKNIKLWEKYYCKWINKPNNGVTSTIKFINQTADANALFVSYVS